MKLRLLLPILICIATLTILSISEQPEPAQAQDPQPGAPVVTGNPNLEASVRVLPYDVDIYGIYLVQGDQMTPVTSVTVDHVNVDRVTAKLSPDGNKVVYLVEYGNTGFSKLVVVGADGLNSNTLFESDDSGRYITSFAWSHDSDKVAYSLSRDPSGAAIKVNTAFANPDTEVDPNEETVPPDNPEQLTGEVWITDLAGQEQEQLVDRGAMEVLGWTSDDNSVFFTRYVSETSNLNAEEALESTRNITPTALVPASLSIVETEAITDPTMADLIVNTLPDSSLVTATASERVYFDFQILETDGGSQKLAAISTSALFETLPFSDTVLSIADLGGIARLGHQSSLTLVDVVTNSDTIANVSISPDGSRFAYMTEETGALWVTDSSGGSHTEVVASGLATSDEIVWGSNNDSVAAASLGEHTVKVLSIGGSEIGSLSAVLDDNLVTLAGSVVRDHNTPHIHQLWDTPDWFGGNCACGPTSAAMALAFYQKLSPHPITVSVPTSHTSNYGFYIPEKFGSFTSRGVGECPGSQLGYGLYGNSMDSERYAWAWRIQDSIQKLGISTAFDGSATYNEVKAALDRGHLVVLSTGLTGAGHIVLARGYTSDGKLIVNDPYGDKLAGSYGQKHNGGNVQYSWSYMGPKWFVEVNGTPPVITPPRITHWKGEYFTNRTLSGQPALIRNDTSLNFNWGSNSPNATHIPADNFSVRWTRRMYFSGVYKFKVEADDGVRLYVDGRRVIDAWRDQGATTYTSGYISLSRGDHTIQLEYYENGGSAVAKLWWDQVDSNSGGSTAGWQAEYYNNPYLSGSPTFTRRDDSIYFNWQSGGPGNGVGSDNFSVRWTKQLNVPAAGYYRFYVRSDDGIRLYINNGLYISKWQDQPPHTYYRDIYLAKGTNNVKVEYYERGGGAYARVWMEPIFIAQYFNNRTLSGSPKYSRYETKISNNWGSSSPNWQIPTDNFSARWTGNVSLSGGQYQFCTRTDDGVRLYVSGTRIIDRWQDQAARTYCTSRSLSKGFHEIKMEYYERGGSAEAQMWWSKTGGVDALSAAGVGEEVLMEEDIMALYNDYGFMGPLIEEDVPDAQMVGDNEVYLPVVVK